METLRADRIGIRRESEKFTKRDKRQKIEKSYDYPCPKETRHKEEEEYLVWAYVCVCVFLSGKITSMLGSSFSGSKKKNGGEVTEF